jgi:hypothetical protein
MKNQKLLIDKRDLIAFAILDALFWFILGAFLF